MNKDFFEGKWHELKGKVKEKWGKLTENDLTEINGKTESLLGKLQKHYGYAKDQAEREINEFEKSHREQKGQRDQKDQRGQRDQREEREQREKVRR